MTSTVRLAVGAGVVLGAMAALIYVLDRNRALLDQGIASFSKVGGLEDLFFPQGDVTEGDPNDFSVIGTFGDTTKAQKIRSKPIKV